MLNILEDTIKFILVMLMEGRIWEKRIQHVHYSHYRIKVVFFLLKLQMC